MVCDTRESLKEWKEAKIQKHEHCLGFEKAVVVVVVPVVPVVVVVVGGGGGGGVGVMYTRSRKFPHRLGPQKASGGIGFFLWKKNKSFCLAP